MPHLERCVREWSSISASRELAVFVPIGSFEQLAISYVRSRLVAGSTFVVTAEFANMTRESVLEPSSADFQSILDAYFSPRPRPAQLMINDIVVTVVDAYPERKQFTT